MNVLIIGGTGLISTPMTRFLRQQQVDVTLYNRGASPVRVPAETRIVHGDRQNYAAFEAQMQAVAVCRNGTSDDQSADERCLSHQEAAGHFSG